MKATVPGLIAAGLIAFGASAPALAAPSAGEAVSLCKNEVKARYGDEARTRIHRIRDGRVTRVWLNVRGVSDGAFRVQCQINDDFQVTDVSDNLNRTATGAVGG